MVEEFAEIIKILRSFVDSEVRRFNNLRISIFLFNSPGDFSVIESFGEREFVKT